MYEVRHEVLIRGGGSVQAFVVLVFDDLDMYGDVEESLPPNNYNKYYI